MNKFSLPKSIKNFERTSLRLPKEMLTKLNQEMSKTGYNQKQRSKWIEVTTVNFLKRSDATNLIAEEFIVNGTTESISITTSVEANKLIKESLENVLEKEGIKKDKSAVLRTAIIQKLLASSGMQLSPQETLNKKIQNNVINSMAFEKS
jgi:metal-responsive CopG/Arc/MetJ family transcriptional regulator